MSFFKSLGILWLLCIGSSLLGASIATPERVHGVAPVTALDLPLQVRWKPKHFELLQDQLRTAIADQDLASATAAITAGADLNAEGLIHGTFWQFSTVLMCLVRENIRDEDRVKLLKFMLQLPGLKIDQQSSLSGSTALMYAADMPHYTLDSVVVDGVKTRRRWFNPDCATVPVRILLQAGANANLKNRDGNTALGCALLSNHTYDEDACGHIIKDDRGPVVELLLAHGADASPAGLSERAEQYLQKSQEALRTERDYRLPETVKAVLAWRERRSGLGVMPVPVPTESSTALVVKPARKRKKSPDENSSSPLDQR